MVPGMSIDEHIGRVIRTRRKVMGLTQADLAARLGVRFQQVQKYESAQNRLSAARLYDVTKALEITVAEVFSGFEVPANA